MARRIPGSPVLLGAPLRVDEAIEVCFEWYESFVNAP